MLRALATSFLLFLTVLLAACGDESPGVAMGSAGPTATAQSNVVKGLIRNGVVRALRWQDGAYVEVASVRTGGDGSFTLTIPDPVAGEVLRLELGLAPDGNTEMQCDVADCGFATRGEWGVLSSDLGLTSWASVGEDGNVTIMPMTPVSTLLVSYAGNFGGQLTPVSLAAASQRVAALFNMSPADLLVRPGSVVDAAWMSGATPQAIKLSLVSAAFAELAMTNGTSIEALIDSYVTAFVENNGHLVQDGSAQSLGDLFRSLQNVLASGADPTAVQDWMTQWAGDFLNALQYNQLNTVTCDGACPAFSSNDLITAMGTGEDTLGGDLLLVMQQKGVSTIEQLVARELGKFGWLVSQDSADLAAVTMQVIGYGIAGTLKMPLVATQGLTPTLQDGVLQVTGSHDNGMQVDLSVTLAPVIELLQGYSAAGTPPQFTWAVSGTVQNANVRAALDGSLTLDSTGTNLTALKTAVNAMVAAVVSGDQLALALAIQALQPAVADILRNGEATFTLQGNAGIAKLELVGEQMEETSRLAIEGRGWLHVDMNGGSNGAIVADGAAEFGKLTLPNGDYFEIDPESGHALTFALGTDGTASTSFGANVLSYAAEVSGDGRIGNLGVLLTNLRNVIAGQVQTGLLDLNAVLLQFLGDVGGLSLTVNGQAEIPGLGHTYKLTIAGGHLSISQPDSEEIALDLSFGGSELLVQAGGKWWLVGLDLQNFGYPALVIADSQGGEWSFDLMSLVAVN